MRLTEAGGIRVAGLICAALWAASLTLPAVEAAGGPTLDGLDMLRRGWQALSSGVPSWYANPAFLLASVAALLGSSKPAAVLAGVSLVLALTTFAAPELAARSGRSVPDVCWRIGFYLWLAAQLGLLLSAWVFAARGAVQKNFPGPGSFRD